MGSLADLHSNNSLTAAIERKADESTLLFQVPCLERLLSPIGDIQTTRKL